jgi:AcrR family transcriptional regulator
LALNSSPATPTKEVSIEHVAETAGVSHGLLYRYFPSKRAFFAAVVETEGERLLAASSPDPALSPLDQIKAGLDIYIDQAEISPSAYRMAHQLAADGDPGPNRQERNVIQRIRVLTSPTSSLNTGRRARHPMASPPAIPSTTRLATPWSAR